MAKKKRVPILTLKISDGDFYIQAHIGNRVRKVAILTIVAFVTGIITILAGSAEVYRVILEVINAIVMFTGGQ